MAMVGHHSPKLTQTQTALQFTWLCPRLGPQSKDLSLQLQPLEPALCWAICKLCYQSAHSPTRSLPSSHFMDGKTEGSDHPGRQQQSRDSNLMPINCSLLPHPALPQCFPGGGGIWERRVTSPHHKVSSAPSSCLHHHEQPSPSPQS